MLEEDEFDDLNKKSINICDMLDSVNFYQSEEEGGDHDRDLGENLDDFLDI
jgi:hypothetical protein